MSEYFDGYERMKYLCDNCGHMTYLARSCPASPLAGIRIVLFPINPISAPRDLSISINSGSFSCPRKYPCNITENIGSLAAIYEITPVDDIMGWILVTLSMMYEGFDGDILIKFSEK